MRTKLAAFLMMAMSVNGQVLLTPTNLRSAVEGGPAYTLSGAAGAFRITYTVESTAGVPIAIDDSTTLRLYVWGADGHLVFSNSPSSHPFAPLSEGKVKFTFANISSGEYRLQGVATPASGNTNENWNFTHHMLTVTNPPSATGGGSVSVSVTTTANVTVASSGSGNVVTGITANGSVVTEHRGTVAGGGGDAPVINGQRPTNWNFNASYPFTVTTTTNADGGTITYGLSGSAGTVVIPAGNTSTSFVYFVDTNAQYYTASPTATQLLFFGVTPAAGFSAGGIGMRYIACTGSQVFACYIPQGGLAVSNGTALGGWGYVKGGSATSTNATLAVSGAGSLAVLTGTNIVMHIGAPGGSSSSSGRANGGGLLGYSLGLTTSGGGGTQTNHGAAATATAGATDGSSTNGGNGTATGGAYPGGGGGGGFYSGGGACGGVSLLVVSGGAGSTYVGDGYTSRAASDSASPPSTDHPLYKTPYGVGIGTGFTLTNSNRGNPGFLAVVSYPSP